MDFEFPYFREKSPFFTEARRFHFVFSYLWILNFRIFEKKIRFYGKKIRFHVKTNPFLRKNKSVFTQKHTGSHFIKEASRICLFWKFILLSCGERLKKAQISALLWTVTQEYRDKR